MKKKLALFIFLFLLIIIFFVIYQNISKNYELIYSLEDYEIKESYDKNQKLYTFKINDITYKIKSKYLKHRKLIKDILKEDSCLNVNLNYLNNFIVCQNDETSVSNFYYQDFKNDKEIETYENLEIYNYLENPVFIWNYNNFIYLNNEDIEKIKLFDKDIYTLNLITKYKNYLLVPDYNSDYSFDKVYLISSKNGDIKEYEFNKEIYFNSYFLGVYKNNLYLYDLTKRQEYKINPLKKQIQKSKNVILKNNTLESISENKLMKKAYYFDNNPKEYYVLDDDKLYYKIDDFKLLMTNLKVKDIVYQTGDECFFISDDTLYSIKKDEYFNKIISNKEWEYNYKNIYIF